jgi:hypothetical protein
MSRRREKRMGKIEIVREVAITCVVCGGQEPIKEVLNIFASDLSEYPEPSVMAALEKCRREVKGRLSLSDVISRIDDGRPGADEAWAELPMSEYASCVWTEEMAQAFGPVIGMIDAGDMTAARMAFRESYNRLVNEARANRIPVKWSPSLGHDREGRERAVIRAVELKRILPCHARDLCPELPPMKWEKRLVGDGDQQKKIAQLAGKVGREI